MNFFESDEEEDDIEKVGFYEKSPSISSKFPTFFYLSYKKLIFSAHLRTAL